jgi:phage shock protein PspC (stress-responsive transcriptional regulator)
MASTELLIRTGHKGHLSLSRRQFLQQTEIVSNLSSETPEDLRPDTEQQSWYLKPLQRTPDEAPVAGVIAAIAHTYGFDPRLTRVATVLITLVFPITVLVYIVAWLVVPAAPSPGESLQRLVTDRKRIPIFVALAVVALLGGSSFLGDRLAWRVLPWSVVLFVIAIAVLSLLGRKWIPILILPPLLFLGAAFLVTEPQLAGGWGTRTLTPSEIETDPAGISTKMAGGRLTIDLRQIDPAGSDPAGSNPAGLPASGTPVEVTVEMGVGSMQILLPASSTIELRSFLGTGVVRVDGEDITAGIRQRSSIRRPGSESASTEFVLNLRMGIGVIEIERGDP